MKTHKDGTQPNKDEIFVFGSNMAGVHGAGAAKQAVVYGAKYGKAFGLSGMTYGIPTKDKNLRTLPLYFVKAHIEDFIEFVNSNPDKKFFITRVGCGLAGYRDSEIAPLFKGCNVGNCNFPDQWEKYLKD